MTKTSAARLLAWLSIVGLLTAVVATVIGHLGLGPGYDPLKLTVSDYALSNRGASIEVAMVALALGALALLGGFALLSGSMRVRFLPAVLISVWSAGLLVAAVVPTDPADATTMSTAAYVHRYASVSAFVVLPLAAVLLVARLRGVGPGWSRMERLLAIACAAGLGLLWYVAFPGHRVMMGLVERSLIGVEIVMLAIASFAVLGAGRRLAAVRRASARRAGVPASLAA